MKISTLHDLLADELQDLYSAETQIIEALPKVAEKTTSQELKTGFENHVEESKEQLRRLEEICTELDIDPMGKKCVGIEGILKEGEELIADNEPSPALDMALIAASQRVEHYETATYGTAANYAKELGHDRVLEILLSTLQEEKQTDEKLTHIAEQLIKNLPKN